MKKIKWFGCMMALLTISLLILSGCDDGSVNIVDGSQTSGESVASSESNMIPGDDTTQVNETPDRNDDTTQVNETPDGNNENLNPAPSVQKYTVIFDYNDGSGQTMEVQIPQGSTIDAYAPALEFSDREVKCWSMMQDGAAYTALVTKNLTLYAQYTLFTPVIYTDRIPTTVNDRFVEIHVSGDSTVLSDKVLRVGSKVERLTIIGDGTVYSDFAITINERSNDIDVVFDEFAYSSNQTFGLQAVANTVDYTVNLTIENTCIIDCSSANPLNNAEGITCISAPNLSICGNGSLTLQAGNGWTAPDKATATEGNHGENAQSGTNGGNGIQAQKVKVEQVTLTIIAGDGGNGGKGGKGNNAFLNYDKNGGKGGNGGAGGMAVSASVFETKNATLNFTAGNGGNGGNGGNAGGSNAATTGVAGHGGAGGRGGDVFSSTTNYNNSGSVCNYTPGVGGSGGKGGNAKDAVDILDGNAGASGASGNINAD